MKLSDSGLRNLKPGDRVIKKSDGEGLRLWIEPKGHKRWVLAYRYWGKQKSLCLGSYPAASLADARKERDTAKTQLAKGLDPVVERKAANATTFRAVSDEYLEQQRQRGRASATVIKLEWLLGIACTVFGGKPIAAITAREILALLRTVERRKHYETAQRLRSTVGAVFRYAIASDRAETDATVALRGALVNPPVQHRAAITEPKAFGGLLRAIDGFDGQLGTKCALKLAALLFPRPGELRAAEWTEFDLDKAIWTIPASKTKMRRDHKVPLPWQAVAILADLKAKAVPGKFLFPSIRTVSRPMSENTLNAALRRRGFSQSEMTSHGFRGSASTLLNESRQWHLDAIERQLAHVEKNEVRRAYARGEHWDERIRMMQWWADHLDGLRVGDKVVQLRAIN